MRKMSNVIKIVILSPVCQLGGMFIGRAVGTFVYGDGGVTWRQPRAGLGTKYGWMVAADALRPDVWYLSASGPPNPLKG